MGSKQCAKCGEEVDAAKAFCPGCGNAFVEEEKRTTPSEFDRSNKTVQLGSSMYNQLLSDMGLSISQAPDKESSARQTLQPEPVAPLPQAEQPVAKPAYLRWLIIAAAAVLGLAFLVILAAVVILFLAWRTQG